jgi:DnaJ-domain-containing protein 1
MSGILDQLGERLLELGRATLEEIAADTRRRANKPTIKARVDDDWHDEDDDWRDGDGAARSPSSDLNEMLALLGIAGGAAVLYSRARQRAKARAAAAASTSASDTKGGASSARTAGARPRARSKPIAAPSMSDAQAARVLGVDVGADAKTIKAAFRELVRKAHPDMATDRHKAKAAARTRELIEARDHLLRSTAHNPRKE